MSSKILLPGISREMHFGDQAKGWVLTKGAKKKKKKILLPCLHSVLFPFVATERKKREI